VSALWVRPRSDRMQTADHPSQPTRSGAASPGYTGGGTETVRRCCIVDRIFQYALKGEISMKTMLAIAALALSSASACAQTSGFAGFNVGLGAGYVKPDVKYTDNTNHVGNNYNWDDSDWVFQVDASYHAAVSDKWLVGIGLTLDLNDTNAGTQSQYYGPVKATLKEHGSVYVQPTYVLDASSAVFAKIGYHSVKVEATGNQPYWNDDKFHTQGIGYGVGYKRFINKNVYVQAEIQVVDYGNQSDSNSSGASWSYQQKTTAGILTVGYKF
jgi:hypothetical protein